jgi:hypothetical protein
MRINVTMSEIYEPLYFINRSYCGRMNEFLVSIDCPDEFFACTVDFHIRDDGYNTCTYYQCDDYFLEYCCSGFHDEADKTNESES